MTCNNQLELGEKLRSSETQKFIDAPVYEGSHSIGVGTFKDKSMIFYFLKSSGRKLDNQQINRIMEGVIVGKRVCIFLVNVQCTSMNIDSVKVHGRVNILHLVNIQSTYVISRVNICRRVNIYT